ncbi:MAG TPA: hypothetical protein VLG68_10815 [Gammaproteobacteria bacterium]|nr:hypothetical protein [Gammaproteobacteria bacterium]
MNTRIARQIPLDYAAYAERVDPAVRRQRLRRLRAALEYLPHVLVAVMLVGLLVTASLTGPAPQASQPVSQLGMHQ